MPVYPGTDPPLFFTACSIDDVGFLEKKITMYSHTGTHIDAPAHIIQGAKTLDHLSIDHFIGKASSLNLTSIKKQAIDIPDIEPYQDLLKDSEFILLHTGWDRFWGAEEYFASYPVLSAEAALWLTNFRFKGLGVDTISVDETDSNDFPIHKILLKHDMIIIENLTCLHVLPNNHFMFTCFPLKIEQGDGSPVRATAIIK